MFAHTGRPPEWLRRVALVFILFVPAGIGCLLAAPDEVGAQDKFLKDHSDLDSDGDVDLEDLKLFSSLRLEKDWTEIDWPSWVVADANQLWEKHYHRLFAFIYEYYGIVTSGDPLAVKNPLTRPTRIALTSTGQMWVSDPGVGSVFLLNSSRQRVGELRGFESPFGIAVDANGRLYVGDDYLNRIEVYEPDGRFVRNIGVGLIRKPVDIDIHDGLVYVADLDAAVIWVFDTLGTHKRTIRKGQLGAPMAVKVVTRLNAVLQEVTELYVADAKDHFVKVYDTQGQLLRIFGGFPTSSGSSWGWGTVTWNWKGKFVTPQSIDFDADGKIHVLDIYIQKVQILDPVTGTYEDDYGEVGDGEEQFRLPLGIVIDGAGKTLAADSQLARVEVIR